MAFHDCPNITVLSVAVADLHKELVLSLPSSPSLLTLEAPGLHTWPVVLCPDHRMGRQQAQVGSGSLAGGALTLGQGRPEAQQLYWLVGMSHCQRRSVCSFNSQAL